ncbi:hypothetical protein [Methylobacter psychrophilus]|nr:hypothetical protein [Methylobacter psychrophilus]
MSQYSEWLFFVEVMSLPVYSLVGWPIDIGVHSSTITFGIAIAVYSGSIS